MEGAQQQVVHAEEEVRLACLNGLAAVERGTRGALCVVKELLVELGAAHVVVRVVVHVVARVVAHVVVRVVARGYRAYWRASAGSGGTHAEEVLRSVDDRVPDGVEHLEGRVSLHGAQRGAHT